MAKSDIEKMYARQQITPSYGGESICHSAIISCSDGCKKCVLNIERDHGRYVGNAPQIDAKDGKNLYFGTCSITGRPCRAQLSDWYRANETDLMFDERTLSMEASVPQDEGFKVCSMGGVQEANTSGQNPEYSAERFFGYVIPENEEITTKRVTAAYGRIMVKETGYYSLLAYTYNEDDFWNSSVQLYLINFIGNYKKRGDEKYFSSYILTEWKNGWKKRQVYKTLLYLEKNKDYYLTYNCGTIQTDTFQLLLQPNADLYQSDLSEQNKNSSGLLEQPRMKDGVVTKIFQNEEAINNYESKLGTLDKNGFFNSKISGINCCLMWSINEALVNDFSESLPWTVTNIFYIDQSLGAWLYIQLSLIATDKKIANSLKNKIKSFFTGIGETAASAAIPSMLVDAGIITAAQATPAGIIISVLFLCTHLLASEMDGLNKSIELLHNYYMMKYKILSTPVALIFKTKRDFYHLESIVTTMNDVAIEPWDGTVISAVGGKLEYGDFVFNLYSEFDRTTLIEELQQEIES